MNNKIHGIGNIIDYGSFSLFSINWHFWECEYHVSVLRVEWRELDRSFISIGRKDNIWFIDLFWIRLSPSSN